MPGWRQLATVLACLASFSTPACAGHAERKQEARREQALQAFQHDLVNVLALRADALSLLGAALLARPLPTADRLHDFHALIERAAQAPDAGPAASWVRLADCDATADGCPNDAALSQLAEQAPDNAAVWLVKLGRDLRRSQADAARRDLAHAAHARLYDDYVGTSLQALARDVGSLPPPRATLDPHAAAGAAAVQTVIVYGTARMQPQPVLQAAAGQCREPGDDEALLADCLALAHVLEWGSSPLARSLGLHLRETLDPDPARREDARRARRDLVWQLTGFNRLLARSQDDPALAGRLLALAGRGGTEMSLMLAALRGAGLPTEAPAGWTPHGD